MLYLMWNSEIICLSCETIITWVIWFWQNPHSLF